MYPPTCRPKTSISRLQIAQICAAELQQWRRNWKPVSNGGLLEEIGQAEGRNGNGLKVLRKSLPNVLPVHFCPTMVIWPWVLWPIFVWFTRERCDGSLQVNTSYLWMSQLEGPGIS